MAFGDVFAGWEKAAGEHYQNLLQMDYQNKRDLAARYAKFAEDPRYAPEQQQEFARRAMQIPVMEPGKKLPKEWENMTIQVTAPNQPQQPPTPQTGPLPNDLSGGGQAAPPIAPPSNTRPLEQPMGPEEMAARQIPGHEEETRAAAATKSAELGVANTAEQENIRSRTATMRQLYPTMDPEMASLLALKVPIASMIGTSSVPDVPGSSIALQVDAFGKPINPQGTYTVMHDKLGRAVSAYPKGMPIVGGMHFAMDDRTGHWVGYTMDRMGTFTVHQDLGLTPPQGVPIDSVHHDFKLVQQPDGSIKAEPFTETTTRTRGGAATSTAPAPTPPPNGAAPATIPALSAPTPPKPQAGGGGGTTVGGRALTPEQVMQTTQKAGAFSNMMERMVNVLNKSDMISNLFTVGKIKLATDPGDASHVLVSRLAGLTDDEASLAADYQSLGEDINLLRGTYQATGFRGPQAFDVQQAQRGRLLGDPKQFKNVLTNSLKDSVVQMTALNKALTRGGQPVSFTPALAKAYLILNGMDKQKAMNAAVKDGWQVQ